jgi:hypothetical protein
VAQALEGGRCDLVALSVTRLSGVGEVQEGAVVIHYSGNTAGSAHQGRNGVGIALSERAAKLLVGKPEAISSRIMVATFRNKLTFVRIYVRTYTQFLGPGL